MAASFRNAGRAERGAAVRTPFRDAERVEVPAADATDRSPASDRCARRPVRNDVARERGPDRHARVIPQGGPRGARSVRPATVLRFKPMPRRLASARRRAGGRFFPQGTVGPRRVAPVATLLILRRPAKPGLEGRTTSPARASGLFAPHGRGASFEARFARTSGFRGSLRSHLRMKSVGTLPTQRGSGAETGDDGALYVYLSCARWSSSPTQGSPDPTRDRPDEGHRGNRPGSVLHPGSAIPDPSAAPGCPSRAGVSEVACDTGCTRPLKKALATTACTDQYSSRLRGGGVCSCLSLLVFCAWRCSGLSPSR